MTAFKSAPRVPVRHSAKATKATRKAAKAPTKATKVKTPANRAPDERDAVPLHRPIGRSALSDLLNRANSGNLSARSLARNAQAAGFSLSHDTAARYLRGDHGRPDEATLLALSKVLRIPLSRLRVAASLSTEETEPDRPPTEAATKAPRKAAKARTAAAARANQRAAWRGPSDPADTKWHAPQQVPRVAHSSWKDDRGAADRKTQIEQAIGRYRQLLETADQTLQNRLIAAVSPRASTPNPEAMLDESLWGEAPSEAASSAAELEQLRIRFERRRALAERSVTRDDAAELLRISSQAVTNHLRSGALAGIKEGNRWLIPLWQFDADCEGGFLPGLADVVAAFPGGVVSLSQWVTAPNPNFDDHSPREELAAGNADSVAAAAAALTAAGW